MHNPPHPGEVIREFCIEPLGLSVTKAAKGLGVSRTSLSELLNGR
ncbi:MAG: HigA family addiction module antitoxin, partial [Desulfobacterales bacterium]